MLGYWMFVFASSKTCLDTGCSCLLPQRRVWILDVRVFVFVSLKTCLDTGCSCLLPQRHVWMLDVRVCVLNDMFGYWMFVCASSKTCLDTGCSCIASSKTCLDTGCSCLLPQRHVWILDVRVCFHKDMHASHALPIPLKRCARPHCRPFL
jgi:hypothetical protein